MLIYVELGFIGLLFGEIRLVQRKHAKAVCWSPLPLGPVGCHGDIPGAEERRGARGEWGLQRWAATCPLTFVALGKALITF